MVNKSKVVAVLEFCYSKISPYDYDRARFVMDMLKDVEETHEFAKRGILMLDMIANYTRSSVPSRRELSFVKHCIHGMHATDNDSDESLISVQFIFFWPMFCA